MKPHLLSSFLISLVVISCSSDPQKNSNDSLLQDYNKTETTKSMTTKPDITQLIAKASQSGSNEDLSILWKATLNLDQWHFITKDTIDINARKPFIGVIDNQPWIFVFTDRNEAHKYGTATGNTGFTDKDGNTNIISMDIDKAIEYILESHSQGVYGMRINEGNGWFSPIENLNPIIEHVKNL
jgi:hypothetical protein